MQTFLPYDSYVKSAQSLDRQRLGKQRVETMQIMAGLFGVQITDFSKRAFVVKDALGWARHPAARMWAGHEASLLNYQIAVCREWVARGYRDTCLDKTKWLFYTFYTRTPGTGCCPPWLGNEDFHYAHRSNLIRKDPWYVQIFGPHDDVPYLWPTTSITAEERWAANRAHALNV